MFLYTNISFDIPLFLDAYAVYTNGNNHQGSDYQQNDGPNWKFYSTLTTK